jgi:5-methylcytosine-specific restriction endonuclease McrA
MQTTTPRPFGWTGEHLKLCTHCRLLKPHDAFWKAKSRCITCKRKYPPDKARHREICRRYRRRHAEVWRARQRIHNVKRRQKIEVTDDGSVTAEFLKRLYDTKHCYYCRNHTPKELRSADHKHPISRGGHHSASNLVMACQSCNSSKGAKTEREFLDYNSKNNRGQQRS